VPFRLFWYRRVAEEPLLQREEAIERETEKYEANQIELLGAIM
jgi:hypothetical protein